MTSSSISSRTTRCSRCIRIRWAKPADRVSRKDELEVWARPLADGSLAVGLFNRDEMDMKVAVNWSELGINGQAAACATSGGRRISATFDGEFSRSVPRHGTVFVKVTPVR